METKTHFDLTQAIGNWQQELASQSQLSAEDQRELKTHLSDAIAELQKRGLDAEESFWLARRRVGDPLQLDAEFVKANPMSVWRERMLWMASAVLIVSLWTTTSTRLLNAIVFCQNYPAQASAMSELFRQFSVLAFRLLPIAVFIFLFLRGGGRSILLLKTWFQSRRRFVSTAAVWIVFNISLMVLPVLTFLYRHPNPNSDGLTVVRSSLINAFIYACPMSAWEISFVGLVWWLMQSHDKVQPQAD